MAQEKKKIGKSSVPSFFDFDPNHIEYQYKVIHDIKTKFFKETSEPHYIMLSGSIGSAKSVLMAWLVIKHVTEFDGARAMLGRKALPDLKDTIFQTILEMLADSFEEGVDYWVRHERGYIKFANGSEIISRSWHDRKFKKFRSLVLSMVVIEELTENDVRDWEFFVEVIGRIGRLPHVPENLFISATNPDDPSHPAYKEFIEGAVKSKKFSYYAQKDSHTHVYYSRTEQNPFLPSWYIEKLKKKYDPKMIRRLLYGEWLYISTDVIYHQYDPEKHVVKEGLKLMKSLPLRLNFDFNISKGKLMSSCLFQFNKNADNTTPNRRRFKVFDEVGVEGARTADALEEWAGKGWFDLPHNPKIIVHGDATGFKGDTRGPKQRTDYSIIEKFLANYERKDGQPLEYEIDVPNENPRLRDRHNTANGQLENAEDTPVVAVAIDDSCKLVKAGMANTRLKENAGYIEDQTTEGQDMSTALTYGIWWCVNYEMDEDEEIEFM